MATRIGQEAATGRALRRIWSELVATKQLIPGLYFADGAPPTCYEIRRGANGEREIWRLTRAEVRDKAAAHFQGRVDAIDAQIAQLQQDRAAVVAEGQRVRDIFLALFT